MISLPLSSMPLRANAKAKLLLAEDDPAQRRLLEIWLSDSGYSVLTAGNGLEALALAQKNPLDVVITDLKMPGLDGLQLLGLLKDLDPTLMVIFLSGHATISDTIEALREGRAFDFIQKPVRNLRQLNLAIERALLKRQTVRMLETRFAPREDLFQVEPLSAREFELVRLLARGHETREIANALGLSEKTVRNNLTQLYEKLGVKNRVQAVLTCLQMALV